MAAQTSSESKPKLINRLIMPDRASQFDIAAGLSFHVEQLFQ